MKRFVILLCLVATFISFSLIFTGCRVQKDLQNQKDSIVNNFDSTSYIKKDSTNQLIIKQLKNRIIIIKDSLINIQLAAEKSQNRLSQILAQDTSKLETSYAFSFAWLENGFLNHTIENKKGNIQVHAPVTTIIDQSEKDTTNVINSNIQQNTNVNSFEKESHEKEKSKVVEAKISWKVKGLFILIGFLLGIIVDLVIKLLIKKFKK